MVFPLVKQRRIAALTKGAREIGERRRCDVRYPVGKRGRLGMANPSFEWLEHQIVVGAADSILYAERDGVIRYWNAASERIFGFTAAEALGQSLDLIIPERLRDRHWKGWDQVMASGVTRYGAGDTLSVPASRKDGTTVSVDFTIQLLKDDAGKVVGSAAILRDVTARFEREKALGKTLKELREKLAGK
jgi:PAS domain S-box-containing protein